MILYSIAFFCTSLLILAWFSRGRNAKLSIGIVFMAGLVSGPLAGLGEFLFEREFLSGVHGSVKSAVFYLLCVGPVEEGAKFLAVFLFALRRPDFKNSSDGIFLAVAAALGFAAGENVVYLLSYGPAATAGRLVLGNLGHASFSAAWGYALGVALHEDARFSIVLEGLLLAAVLHGLYDFLLTIPDPGPAFAIVLLGVMIVLFLVFFKRETARHRKKTLAVPRQRQRRL